MTAFSHQHGAQPASEDSLLSTPTPDSTDGNGAAMDGQRVAALARLEERGDARRTNLFRLLFVVGLLAWGSLAVWWATYLYISTQQVRHMTLRAYHAEEQLYALAIGIAGPDHDAHAALEHTPFQIAQLPLDEEVREFPVVELDGPREGLAIIVRPEERARLRLEARRKLVMLAGEGTLLVALLFACLIGLHRMLLTQWRMNRRMESFVHTMTHELKSPIAGIRALLQSLRTLELPAEDRSAYLNLGLAEIGRLDRMVGNILMSSRIEAAAFSPRVERVELGPVLRQLRDRKTLLFREKGGALDVDLADARIVRADPEALDSILENLLDNALKYGGTPPRVNVTVSEGPGGRVRVTVEDQGPGLTQEALQRIFRKFHRVGDDRVDQAKGTGLGLYIARSLARACGGDLVAESDGPGHGTRFTLELRAA